MRSRLIPHRPRVPELAVATLLAVTGIVGLPSSARANGRFPRAERLLDDPADPDSLMIAATYGLLATRDRGKTWYDICESAFSLQDAYTGDPLLDRTGDGTLLVGVQTALDISHDRGCSWQQSLGGSGQGVADYTIVRSAPNTVLALRLSIVDGSLRNDVVESTDAGTSWHTLGVPLPLTTVTTIDVPPSDPTRIYVSGIDAADQGQLVVSHDRGATWTSRAIPNTNSDEVPYIAAVHPNAPDRIFLRTDAWTNRDIIDTANDAFLTSDDEGKTWTERFRTGSKLLGFALSPDGSTVLLGYGDPVDSARVIDDTTTGIYRSSTADYNVERILSGSITCLKWVANGVYVCTSQEDFGYQLAFAPALDSLADAGTLVPMLRRSEVKGPPPCCGAGLTSCVSGWSVACATFDACGDSGTASVVESDPAWCSADAGISSSSDGSGGIASSSGGNSSTDAGGTSTGATSGAGNAPTSSSDGSADAASISGSTSTSTGTSAGAGSSGSSSGSGCSLSVLPGNGEARALALFTALLAGAALRRPRRRRSRGRSCACSQSPTTGSPVFAALRRASGRFRLFPDDDGCA